MQVGIQISEWAQNESAVAEPRVGYRKLLRPNRRSTEYKEIEIERSRTPSVIVVSQSPGCSLDPMKLLQKLLRTEIRLEFNHRIEEVGVR